MFWTYLGLTISAVMWGGLFTAGKLSVSAADPSVVVFLRFSSAGAVLLILAALFAPRQLLVDARSWPALLALAVVGVGAYNLLFFWGLRLTRVVDGAMIVPTLSPALTAVLAAWWLHEPLTRRRLWGIALSLTGQALVFADVLASLVDRDRLLGNLLFLGAACLWAGYNTATRAIMGHYQMSPLALSAWGMLLGGIALALPAWGPFRRLDLATLPPAFWGYIAFLSLGATVVAFLCWHSGVLRLGSGRTAVFTNLVPVFSLAIAWLVLGEVPGLMQLAGLPFVLAGVWLVSAAPRLLRAPG